ncbi:MAG: restriction endonuclease [Cyanobacteriota bacterium]
MNVWTKLSIDYANQRSYLDDLFNVYPTIPEGIRSINQNLWKEIEDSFDKQDNFELISSLLKLKKFPIKNSYVSFLRKDETSLLRNPQTVNRLAGNMYQMGLNKLYEKCTEPKETNTQMGQMFNRWLQKKSLGIIPVSLDKFESNKDNAILAGNDSLLLDYAKSNFNYNKEKGLDFIARFNGKYILGEAKFITDIGGNQDKSFIDIITTLKANYNGAISIGILDGIPWLIDKSKYYTDITTKYSEYNIMSSLVLSEFLYQI